VNEPDERRRKAVAMFHATCSLADKVRRTLKEKHQAEQAVKHYANALTQSKEALAMIKERLRRERKEWKEQETGKAIQKALENTLKGKIYDQLILCLGIANTMELDDPILALRKSVLETKMELNHLF
jgi:adenosyl cobinamide kinase/adenosyl cobinamide phosphate guanylyltransferase